MHRISCDLDQTQKRHFRLGEQLESKSRLLQESAERERQVGCALQQEREKLRVAKEDVRQTYVRCSTGTKNTYSDPAVQ